MSEDPTPYSAAKPQGKLPAKLALALIDEAERVWRGEAEELRFWRHDKHGRIKLMEQTGKRSVAPD